MENTSLQDKMRFISQESEVIMDSSNINQLNSHNDIYRQTRAPKFNHRLNFPEKIIFVIDTVRELSATQFKFGSGVKYYSLHIVKRVIEIFLHNKLMLNQKHEFALVTLDSQKAYWLCDFTANLKILLNALELIEESVVNNNEQYCDIQKAFKLIYQQVSHEKPLLQDNVMRIILFYCRSNILPRFNTTDVIIQDLISNQNFFLDILYIHELPSPENKCEEIYAELNKLDIKNVSYIMEVTRSAAKVHNYMARLLAHPTQRVAQKNIKYCIHPSIVSMIRENKFNS